MTRIVNFDYAFPSEVEAVLFDGKPVKLNQVRIADSKTGELTVYLMDERGSYRFDPVRMDTKIHTFKGKVEIVWKTK